MKELFSKLPRTDHADVLVDTCFLFYVFEHQLQKKFKEYCDTHKVALSSFTVEEVLHHAHHVSHVFRERLRHELHNSLSLFVIDVPVHPGDPDGEIAFVSSIDPELIALVPDHSDAVIAALALRIHAHMLTRDKHHLFTVQLEDYFSKKGIVVKNNL